ncbi:MAG: hypothetical protein DMF71_02245 [Acidobacteria bacterium]|nr:MAG: hypothetical protein DMF71_02245 [Acidobacteriota bacterium]
MRRAFGLRAAATGADQTAPPQPKGQRDADHRRYRHHHHLQPAAGERSHNFCRRSAIDGGARKKGEPIVPYNHVWRAGANEATMFVVTDDVMINGQPLKAGTYSMHTIPGKDEWTIIFNNDAGQWGSFTYDNKKDALRVKTKPQAMSENEELLTYSFEPVTDNSAQVNLRWEKVRVPFTVEVKDVKAAWRAHADALMAANPTNETLPLQVANTYARDKNWDEALKFIDQSVKLKETFPNLSAKANILWGAGKKEEAMAVADAAIAKGKADKMDTAAFEKRVAGMKAGKM